MDKRLTLLRKINKLAEMRQYPGYPFQLTGIIDLKNDKGMFGSYGRPLQIMHFFERFDSKIAFQAFGSYLATKGNWYNNGHQMANFEKFISYDTKHDDFYFDDIQSVQVWFGLYSAYRQFKGQDKFIWFIIDNECEYIDIKVFETEQQIKDYMKEYWIEEEE